MYLLINDLYCMRIKNKIVIPFEIRKFISVSAVFIKSGRIKLGNGAEML